MSKDVITCHIDNGIQSHRVRWNPPTGKHQYGGQGSHVHGKDMKWSDCIYCGKRKNHRIHGKPYTTCSWCGSMHINDFICVLQEHPIIPVDFFPTADWADWKYGYPHKLYVNRPGGMGGKFYIAHLRDHTDRIREFNEVIRPTGVVFEWDGKHLKYNKVR